MPEPNDDALRALAQSMLESNVLSPAGDNVRIPAGYTYLAQFVNHDLTTGPPVREPDGTVVPSPPRTPWLDLDSVYGDGLHGAPPLDPEVPLCFLIDSTSPDLAEPRTLPNDLPREAGRALIGEPRNDENLLVAQMHLAFLKLHNTVVSDLETQKKAEPDQQFEQARRIVQWHYQWIIRHGLLPAVVDEDVLAAALPPESRYFQPDPDRPVPDEFSDAAFRFGHSMVRESYVLNEHFVPAPGVPRPSLESLFERTGQGGLVPLGTSWMIDWRRFFESSQEPGGGRNASRLMDLRVAPGLSSLPGPGGGLDLVYLDLLRSRDLPTGQTLAASMGHHVLEGSAIGIGPDVLELTEVDLNHDTPLWYYILREAEADHGGTRLGSLGSQIVSETILNVLELDEGSYVNVEPGWVPDIPKPAEEEFRFAHMLDHAGVLNPFA